jgi:TnpA family transposase
VGSQKYEDGQANQAGCLNLLTNAVIVWNTVYMQAALEAIQQQGYPVQEADLIII